MIRFNTRIKKPSVWSIAFLSAMTAVLLLVLINIKPLHIYIISIVICLYLLLCIVLLVNAFIKQLQYNPYSYNTIYYIGFALFVLSALITMFVLMTRFNQYDLNDINVLLSLLSAFLGSTRTYMFLSSPFIFFYALSLTISNISLIKHEGKSFTNLLGFILSICLIGGLLLIFYIDLYASGSQFEVMMHDLFTNLLSAIYLYFECMLIGTIVANIIVVRYKPDLDADYIIILGCGLRKDGSLTPLLKGRVDRALDFYHEQLNKTGKEAVFVTSGGQGADEIISESEAMKRYLMECGILEKNILKEDKSSSTMENMSFSKKIIEENKPEAKVIFSTTNFHVFRSGLTSRRVKMKSVGIGSKTKWYFWPNAFVREFVGLLSSHRLKQALVLGIMIIIYCVTTILYYHIV